MSTNKHKRKTRKTKSKIVKLQSKTVKLQSKTVKLKSGVLYGGDSILSGLGKSIGSAVYHKNPKSYNVKVPYSGYVNLLNPEQLAKRFETQKTELLTITYNNININTIAKGTILPSSKLSREPRIMINSINRYYLVLRDRKRILWLSIFANRTIERKLLPYKAPNPKLGKIRKLWFILYKCPDPKTVIQYKPDAIATEDRKQAYNEFTDYIKKHNLIIAKLITILVKFDVSGGISVFNAINTLTKQRKITKFAK